MARAFLADQLSPRHSSNSGCRSQQHLSRLLALQPLEDRRVLASFAVTTIDDSGPGSLREAVIQANALPGPDSISFSIPGEGVHTISPVSALPSLLDEVSLDATTQPGYSGEPLIEIDGALAGQGVTGLQVNAPSVIKGFAINSFGDRGIRVDASDVQIVENFLGTDSSGVVAKGGGSVWLSSGVNARVANNLISGNSPNPGVLMTWAASAASIQGNKIGTDKTGTVSVPNLSGIVLDSAGGNLIGGRENGQGNLVSGNLGTGIDLASGGSTGNRIEGNLVGASISGEDRLGNARIGVSLRNGANGNTIGGSENAAANVIVANGSAGLYLQASMENIVEGNYVGTNAAEDIGYSDANALWNKGCGIQLVHSSNNVVRTNTASANNQSGMCLYGASHDNELVENAIGTDRSGEASLGNNLAGVEFQASGGSVPTNNLLSNNLIHHNDTQGVDHHAGVGNSFLGNLFVNNRGFDAGSNGLAIDLNADGVSANDPDDIDGVQNYPVLTSVVSANGVTVIDGLLSSVPSSHFLLEFYSSEIGDVLGHGEGQRFLGTAQMVTDEVGNAAFSTEFPIEIAENQIVTATATQLVDHDGDPTTPLVPRATSEFAENVLVGNAAPIGVFEMAESGTLSVGIYDQNNDLVRVLYEAVPREAGPIELFWDGRDDFGNERLGGGYEWRAIVHDARAVDDGSVGDRGGEPSFELYENSHFATVVAVDPLGGVYENSFFEEAPTELRKWDKDGKPVWAINYGDGGYAIAADADSVYVAIIEDGINGVRRFSAVDGTDTTWATGPLLVNANAIDGISGLGVDSDYLWVSNRAENRVELYDKETGLFVRQFGLANPFGLAADDNGNAWVASGGSEVTQVDSLGNVLATIQGLDQPRAVAIGGPAQNLYVANFGSATVREYDPSTGVMLRELFGKATPGPVSDYLLRWSDTDWDGRGLAVDSVGQMTVADFGNQRVLTYDASGMILRTRSSEYIPAPFTDPNVDPNMLFSGVYQYSVDYTSGPNYGNWELTHNWRPEDQEYFGTPWFNQRRRLSNGQDYLFSLNAEDGVSVWALDPEGMRLSAIVGLDETGLWDWTDQDRDGDVQEGEKRYQEGPENSSYRRGSLSPGVWVDHRGDFWIAQWAHWRNVGPAIKVPLQGFDADNNPVYDWSKREEFTETDLYYDFRARNVRVQPGNGDVYLLGTTELAPDVPIVVGGGTAVDRRAADGSRISLMHTSDPIASLAVGNDPDFFFTGHTIANQGFTVRAYTSDGLLIAEGQNQRSGAWIDHGMGLSAISHPNGSQYVYAEEVFYGTSVRFRIDGLETLVRHKGAFNWGEEPSFSVTTTADSGPGSLRQAMIHANLNPGPDSIDFAIPGTGVHTIDLLSTLPELTETTIVDATTQPGYSWAPLIELSGMLADPDRSDTEVVDGLVANGVMSEIRGLVVNGFTGNGIVVRGQGTVVESNYIGTDASGEIAKKNDASGVFVISGRNGFQETLLNVPEVIVSGNLVSGHDSANGAIRVFGSAHVSIQGNRIGTNAAGTIAIPNYRGVNLDWGIDVSIGGVEPGEGNLISGNSGDAIVVGLANESTVQGNLIGTDISGTKLIGNGRAGIVLANQSTDVLVGGDVPGARNVIAGGSWFVHFNRLNGTEAGNVVAGNYFGTDVSGETWFGSKSGVLVQESSGQIIRDNLIAGSLTNHGVWLYGDSDNNMIQSNHVGTDMAGVAQFGAAKHGIEFLATSSGSPDNNQVLSNSIAFNAGTGILVSDGTGNALLGNRIYGNGGLGIDLGGDGVTANDLGDSDVGGNRLQNYPVLSSVISGDLVTTIKGSLESSANTSYRIEVFASDSPDASGHGEAQVYLGHAVVLTNDVGEANFVLQSSVTVPEGHFATATATRLDELGDHTQLISGVETSEFSANVSIQGNHLPQATDGNVVLNEDQTIQGSLTQFVTDLDGDTLSFSSLLHPAHGQLNLLSHGEFSYTPDQGFTGVDRFTYQVNDGNGGVDQGEVQLTVRNLVDLSGTVFDDLNNDGIQDPNELGIPGVRIQVWDEALASMVDETETDADGHFLLDSNLPLGSYKLVQSFDDPATAEVEDAGLRLGLLDGKESAGSLGGQVENLQDSDVITGITVGAPGTQADGTGYRFAEIRPSSLQGMVFEDFNDDGLIDYGELAIDQVEIQLSGVDDRGNLVLQSQATNVDGIFEFVDLRPGTYEIIENQPETTLIGEETVELVDAKDVVGTIDGIVVGDNNAGDPPLSLSDDRFTSVLLTRPESNGYNYNFAERLRGGVQPSGGVAATIGFWQSRRGKRLIRGLNGDESNGQESRLLGRWLATTFPNLYGNDMIDLSEMNNAEVHDLYRSLFKRHKKRGPVNARKLDAQVMAVAFATYVTRSSLVSQIHTGGVSQEAVDHVSEYGFDVSAGGLGAMLVNVGSKGAAFGVDDDAMISVMDLLLAVNQRSHNGLLYDVDHDQQIDCVENDWRVLANKVFRSINKK